MHDLRVALMHPLFRYTLICVFLPQRSCCWASALVLDAQGAIFHNLVRNHYSWTDLLLRMIPYPVVTSCLNMVFYISLNAVVPSIACASRDAVGSSACIRITARKDTLHQCTTWTRTCKLSNDNFYEVSKKLKLSTLHLY